MLGAVLGELGSGKTLFLSLLAKTAEHNKMPIYSNFTLRMKHVKNIDIGDLEMIRNGLLLIDEAYLWLESRASSSMLNKYISRLIFQSRKRGFDFFISSQLHGAVDLRFRFLEDLTVYACGLNDNEDGFEYFIRGWGKVGSYTLPYTVAEKFFPLFDTMEYPESAPTEFETTKYNKEVNKIVNKIIRDYSKPEKLTLKMIKDICIEKGITDHLLIDGVYARLKREALKAS